VSVCVCLWLFHVVCGGGGRGAVNTYRQSIPRKSPTPLKNPEFCCIQPQPDYNPNISPRDIGRGNPMPTTPMRTATLTERPPHGPLLLAVGGGGGGRKTPPTKPQTPKPQRPAMSKRNDARTKQIDVKSPRNILPKRPPNSPQTAFPAQKPTFRAQKLFSHAKNRATPYFHPHHTNPFIVHRSTFIVPPLPHSPFPIPHLQSTSQPQEEPHAHR